MLTIVSIIMMILIIPISINYDDGCEVNYGDSDYSNVNLYIQGDLYWTSFWGVPVLILKLFPILVIFRGVPV